MTTCNDRARGLTIMTMIMPALYVLLAPELVAYGTPIVKSCCQ